MHRFVVRVQRLIYNLRRQLITDAKPILKRIEWLTHLILSVYRLSWSVSHAAL
jgi:hypothetical protein